MKTLKVLSISWNPQLGNDIAKLNELSLAVFSACGCDITDEEIAQFRQDHLYLSKNPITDKSLPTLCALKPKQLLQVYATKMSRSVILTLINVMPNCNISDKPTFEEDIWLAH